MSLLLVLAGIGLWLLLLRTPGTLPSQTRRNLRRAITITGIGIGLVILVRIGQPGLAAAGALLTAAWRLVGPLLPRLLPLLFAPPARQSARAAQESSEPTTNVSSQMTRAEALEVLGLAEGVSDEAIRQAHAELIKKVHPDRGGTSYLAARVNLARDLLLPKDRR